MEVIDERADTVADPPPLNIALTGISEVKDEEAARLRYLKVLHFWDKKARRSFEKKIVSKNRKKIAENKLRIQGKFVTIEQAIKMVGKRQVNRMLKE